MSEPADLIAVVGATVLDGNGGPPLKEGSILIEGDRIIAVKAGAADIPPRARRIDAAGKYVIPGLMDANVHLVADHVPLTLVRYEGRYHELAIEAAQVALKAGVTTVFDSWGPREPLIKARDAVNQGRVTASRIYLAGNIVGFGGPFSKDFFPQAKDALFEDFTGRINAIWQENVGPELLAMSPEQVRQAIREHAQSGIDFLKYAVSAHGSVEILFSPRVQRVIVEEAHRAGITVQSHQMSAEGVRLAIDAGVDLMQHCEITLEHPMPADTIDLIVERKVPGTFLANTRQALEWFRERAPADAFFKRFDIADANERALLQAGATILLATDAGVFSRDTLNSSFWKKYMPLQDCLLELGAGHFHWLLAMEQKGMKPMDALMAATRNIARAYKVDRDLGTLEKGRIADLVILDKNPLASAANYRAIHLVMKEGRVVEREALPSPGLLTAG